MVDASDIITYIGVPLAVLGVLPILYTFFYAYITRNRITKALLKHGHHPSTRRSRQDGFNIRSSPMTSLIEVELPRYTIAPLDRIDEEYWTLGSAVPEDEESRALVKRDTTESMFENGRVHEFLQGGSWRAFNWKRLPVGHKLYRVQYADELREPPAEIEFSQLVDFLLDWGAELNHSGWNKLKTAGLWAPVGTVLLQLAESDQNKARHHDWVLRTSTAQDSDGILTLCVKWPRQASLPPSRSSPTLRPGWARLSLPTLPETVEKHVQTETSQIPVTDHVQLLLNALAQSEKLSLGSIRFCSVDGRISNVSWECNKDPTIRASLSHLSRWTGAEDWFTAAVCGLVMSASDSDPGSFFTPTIPARISKILVSPLLPCGVLVLLDIVPSDVAPSWESSPYDSARESMKQGELMLAKHRARTEAQKLEATMSESHRSAAKAARERQEIQAQMQEAISNQRHRKEQMEQRERDAVSSSGFDLKTAAEHAIDYLRREGQIPEYYQLFDIVNVLVFLFILDKDENGRASQVFEVLEAWRAWSELGGMKVEQLRWLRDRKIELCLAICVAVMAQEGTAKHNTSAVESMMECLGHWKTVRLG